MCGEGRSPSVPKVDLFPVVVGTLILRTRWSDEVDTIDAHDNEAKTHLLRYSFW